MKPKFSVGDRIQVSNDFFWAKGATGILSAPPGGVTVIGGPWDGGLTRQEKSMRRVSLLTILCGVPA